MLCVVIFHHTAEVMPATQTIASLTNLAYNAIESTSRQGEGTTLFSDVSKIHAKELF